MVQDKLKVKMVRQLKDELGLKNNDDTKIYFYGEKLNENVTVYEAG